MLEVLVAMAIVSLAAVGLSLAWPNWIESGQSQRAMTELTSFISAARDKATQTGMIVTLAYDAGTRRLTAGEKSAVLPALARVTMQGATGEANARLAFYPDGSSSGARIEIKFAGRQHALRISRLTGVVHE